MATDQRISALPSVTSPSSTDVLPIVSAGVTSQVTVSNLHSTLATTGSNTFSGNQTIDGNLSITGTTTLGGNIVPSTPRGATLGTLSNPFADIFVSSGSINIAGIVGQPNTTLSNVSGALLVSAGNMQLVGSASFIAQTGSFSYISGAYKHDGTLNQVGDTQITGSLNVTGDIKTNGNIIAQQYIVSSSVTYLTESFASGSHKFGNSLDDNHNFTGSVNITGSLTINGTSYTAATSGTSGVNGSSGTSGASGSSGTSGSSGSNGSSGTSGSSGSNGSSGASGSSGTSGSSGSNGSSGTSGTSGVNGTSGTSGLLTLTETTVNGIITYNGSGTNATVQSGLTFSNNNLVITGSLIVSGSQTITGDITRIGNDIITGSLIVTGSLLMGGTAQTYISAVSITNPSNYVIHQFLTSSYHGATYAFSVVEDSTKKTTVYSNYVVAQGNNKISSNIGGDSQVTSEVSSPNPSFTIAISGSYAQFKVTDTGTFTYRGIVQLY